MYEFKIPFSPKGVIDRDLFNKIEKLQIITDHVPNTSWYALHWAQVYGS